MISDINMDTLDLKRENERTYIKKKLDIFMCDKCDMICTQTIPIPDDPNWFSDESKNTKFANDVERRRKTPLNLQANLKKTKRIYCISCDEEYSNARKNYGLIKHWLCCWLLC